MHFFVATLVALVGAATPASDLAKARTLIQQDLEYDAGIRVLERLTSDPRLDAPQRVEAYQLLGTAYVAVGAPDAAEAAFAALLELAPEHTLDPLLSPKIHDAFARARAKVVRPVRLQQVTALPEGRMLRVTARVDDAQGRLRAVRLIARTDGGTFEGQDMARSEAQVEGAVPLPELGLLRVDYYLEGLDAAGRVIASAGSAQAPSSLVVDRAPASSPAPAPGAQVEAAPSRWWIWVVAGAAVVGGAVAAGVLLSRDDGAGPPGTLDAIVLD